MTPERRRIIGMIVVCVVAVGLIALTYYLVHRVFFAPPSDREHAFTSVVLTLPNGETLDTSAFAGKPVVIVTWATWCPSCVEALSAADGALAQYRDRVHVVAVNRTEEKSIIDDYRRVTPLPEGIIYAHDEADAYFDRIGGQSMPEVLVYDSTGRLIAHLLAAPTTDELAAYVESAL